MTRATFYNTLEIDPNASPQEIREAYLRTKSAYQRDSAALYTLISTDLERENLLQQIEEAYLVLSDPEKRRLYDKNHFSDQTIPCVITTNKAFKPASHSEPSPSSFTNPKPESTSNSSLDFSLQKQQASFINRPLPGSIEQEIQEEKQWSGASLKSVRLAYQISLEEMSHMTKISKNYITAIEEENFDKLPAWVYIRGFIMQLTKILKLPQEPILKYYSEASSFRPGKTHL